MYWTCGWILQEETKGTEEMNKSHRKTPGTEDKLDLGELTLCYLSALLYKCFGFIRAIQQEGAEKRLIQENPTSVASVIS